ncbi:hypothetical protein MNV49_002932 [Pseudohyphozyma bogoriensis]|nr:hypothetical protein MNV49_002932 [Pseudohyphozyma bogoriensis]
MLFTTSLVLSALLAPLASAAPSAPTTTCITDLKIEACSDFDCQLKDYHRIDAGLTQRDNATSWSYVFYKTEKAPLSSCITDLTVVEEGASGPSGSEWSKAAGSAHAGLTSGGGPTIHVARSEEKQAEGRVVDWIVLKPGKSANSTEDFQRTFVNLGLGEAAGEAAVADWKLYNYISSGWVWLMYSNAGPRQAITDIRVLACNQSSDASDCGMDWIKAGWQRRDIDLNGPTVGNGSHVFLFTTTAAQNDSKCVTHLGVENSTDAFGAINVDLNDGTNGTSIYLAKYRARSQQCLTSIVAQSVSYFTPLPSYIPVLDSTGQPADLNLGIGAYADEVYLLTSTAKSLVIPEKPELSFREDGTFRISHYSDLHTMQQEYLCLNAPEFIKGNCTEKFASSFMERTLDLLDPDFVVINGDLFSEDQRKIDGLTFPMQAMASVMKVLHPIVDRGLPWAVTFGNHDGEGDSTVEELMRIYQNVPGFIGSRGEASLPGIGNYELTIKKSAKSKDDAFRLWFFDSHPASPRPSDGSTAFDWEGEDYHTKWNGVGYGKIQPSQIEWYKSHSKKLNEKKKTNAFAFYHIPLPEMALAWQKQTTRSLNLSGTHVEPLCVQGQGCEQYVDITKNKVGLFEAFEEMGDVLATFSGHDHETDITSKILFNSSATEGIWMTCDGNSGYGGYSSGADGYNREMRFTVISDHGDHALSYKVIDDVFAGTVHRNASEPIVNFF